MSRSVSAPSSVTNTSPCWNGLIVPGSTFRYGSHFCSVTLKPRLSRRQPMEEAATPFPSEETTPPVTKIYFGAIRGARTVCRADQPSAGVDVHAIMSALVRTVKSKSWHEGNQRSVAAYNFCRHPGFYRRAYSAPVQALSIAQLAA